MNVGDCVVTPEGTGFISSVFTWGCKVMLDGGRLVVVNKIRIYVIE